MCDGAVCGGVYPGAPGAPQCVCMSVEAERRSGIDSILVLRLRAGL